jgi:outer membrane protein assembly factor BamB
LHRRSLIITRHKQEISVKTLAWITLIALALTGGSVAAQTAPLGAPDYKPSAEHPYGWRGDWTGRFPGATPPTQWSRRAKAVTTDLKYQADKPKGEPAAEAKALEYFSIKDWLVAGPFSVDDPVADLGKDFLNGEATVEPAKDAPAGTSTWKFLRADVETQSRHECNGGTCGNSNVDFVFAFGKISGSPKPKLENADDFTNKLAYAHTYIYSPSEAKVQLEMPFDGKAGRFWLNGKPTDLDPKNRSRSFPITLSKGWNRLLVKITVENALRAKDGDADWASKWLVAAYLTPAGPVSYETKNITWMTPLSGRSVSQPIIVGDRIFIGSATTDLMCLDKKTGKVLWLHANTPYDTLSDEDHAALPDLKEKIEPLVAKLNALTADLVSALNAAISPQGLASPQQAALEALIKSRTDAERAVHNAFENIDKKKYCALWRNEVSPANAAPVSDGQHVFWACGGSQWSSGNYLIACFDLDGKRVWTRLDPSLGAAEHGNHSSPALIDGKLIFSAHQTLIAYDPKTGHELWRKNTTDKPMNWTNTPGQPVPAKIGDTNVIIAHQSLIRASDGSFIGPSFLDTMFSSGAPIVDNGIMYDCARYRGQGKPFSIIAVKLPAAPAAKAQVLFDPDGKDISVPIRGLAFQIASCLYEGGMLYTIEMGGGLSAVDLANKKCDYRLWLDGYNRYNRMVYGVCASPTLAGKNIYITDDAGYTHILAPGPQFKELQHNVLENIFPAGQGGNPCKQESFYTSPIFEGKSMYLRGEEYLYCIAEKQPTTRI